MIICIIFIVAAKAVDCLQLRFCLPRLVEIFRFHEIDAFERTITAFDSEVGRVAITRQVDVLPFRQGTVASMQSAVGDIGSSRIGCTIQLCDAGLQPGAGVGNARSGLDRQSMGVPVIAIGVPLVVYASTISRDTVGLIAGELGLMNNEESVKELAAKAISEKTGELIVTPKEIDALIGSMSAILSNAINMALFGTDHAELKSLIA